MHLQIPDKMGSELSDEAWCRVVQLTAETAVVVANDLARLVMVLREENEGLERRLAGEIQARKQIAAEAAHWTLTAETRRYAMVELARIAAARLWHALFSEEADTIDSEIRAGRKIHAVKSARQFLGTSSLYMAKTLVEAREKVLDRG